MAISDLTLSITSKATLSPSPFKNSNENTIDRASYLTFLKTLKFVHEECHISLRNAARLEINNQEFIAKQLSKAPLSLSQFLNKIRKYSTNFLFGAEAVQRTKEEALVWTQTSILDEWTTSYKNFIYNIKPQAYNSCPDAAKLFHRIIPKLTASIKNKEDYKMAEAWQPKLSEALIPFVLERIEKIEKRIFILACSSEIKPEEMPQPNLSTFSMMSNKAARFFDILCYSYGNSKNYSFNKNQQQHIKDEDVINILKHEDLENLDLSNCTSLTNSCLRQGNEKLQQLTLSYTYLEATEIDPSKFPSLKNVIYTIRKKGLFINSPPHKDDHVLRLKFKDKKLEIDSSLSLNNINLSSGDISLIPNIDTAKQNQNDNSNPG